VPQYTVGNTESDGSTFTLPSTGGFEIDNTDASGVYHWYAHVENGFDVSVDVTVQGSHYQDPGMSAAVDDTTETVASGATTAVDGEAGHSYLRVEVTPAGDPLSGEVVVTIQKRRA